jgi:hypothetical protein
MDEDILNIIYLLYVLNDVSACFSYKLSYKSICTNMHTDTYESVRTGVTSKIVSWVTTLNRHQDRRPPGSPEI